MAVVSIEYGTLAIEVGLVFNFASSFCRRISFSAKYSQAIGMSIGMAHRTLGALPRFELDLRWRCRRDRDGEGDGDG
jgi:hypothetical protein